MANATKGGVLAKSGGILGPVLGAVIGVLLIVGAIMTDEIATRKSEVTNAQRVVDDRLRRGDVEQQPEALPTPAHVAAALRPRPEPRQELPMLVTSMNELPIAWTVNIAAPEVDVFARYSSDGQTWTREEFTTARREVGGRITGSFEDWDRNRDDAISRQEFDQGPRGNADEEFRKRDLDGNGRLEAPAEITEQELRDMDWSQQGWVEIDDYRRFVAEGPAKIYNFGDPADFRVVVDPARMEVRLSWSPPSAENLPPDLKYTIERYAPLTVEARRRQFAQDISEHQRRLSEWDGRRDRWLDSTAVLNDRGEPDPNGTPDADGRTFRAVVQAVRRDAAYVAWSNAKGEPDPQPVAPRQPTDWEVVNNVPVQETEYVDNTFELGVSYVYAVRAVTESILLKGTPSNDLGGGLQGSDRVESTSAPVLIRNRISMGLRGVAGDSGTIQLTQWLAVRGAENETSWYQISVITPVDTGANRAVGGNYSMRDLADRSVKMSDVDGREANAADLLAQNARVDFTTGFSFLGVPSAGFLLEHPEYGNFELTRATRDAAAEIPSSDGMENPTEVRLLAVASGARSGTFEVMRWTRVGESWYRVVLTARDVSAGGAVGRQVSLASPGSGVVVYDSAGRQVAANVLGGADFREATVDLGAGTFDGVEGRVAIVGGKRFDLFATLFVD